MVNCLDFGHAYIEASRPWNRSGADDLIPAYLGALGDDVVHLHLCNNDGQNDLHTATPDGALSYEKYRDFLAGFEHTACLEVSGSPESVRRSAEHIRGLAGLDA